ncbi:MAG: amidase [Alphaproteobacteria bacterium]
MDGQASDYGAFVPHGRFRLDGAATGPLRGLTFVVKDLFDIAGQVSGNGSPDWRRTHKPATETAPSVAAILAAGAACVGRTVMDEMAYGLSGENIHDGSPVNPAAPGRFSGGSSGGSAVAVAAGLVDFALGSDTGGSIRIPASYCGIFGFRPSHGRISLDGLVPMAPSFDTVGWFARDAHLLQRVGQVLLDQHDRHVPTSHTARLADDAFALTGERASRLAEDAGLRLGRHMQIGPPVRIADLGTLDDWRECFRTCQAAELWQIHGAWVKAVRPNFGPAVRTRFEIASHVTPAATATQRAMRAKYEARMRTFVALGDVLVLPTAPGPAPLRQASAAEIDQVRGRTLALTAPAGIAGLPQVSIPAWRVDGAPMGLSLIGPRGSDEALLALAARLANQPESRF